ncbi:hypothetical protein ABZ810_00780, partial [Spirillospora sp. NPDC047279]
MDARRDHFDELLEQSSFGGETVREIQQGVPPEVLAALDFRLTSGCASLRGTVDDIILRLVWACRTWGEGEPPPGFAPPVEDALPGLGETMPEQAARRLRFGLENSAHALESGADDTFERALERWDGDRLTQVIAPSADGSAMIIHEVCSGRPARMLRYLIDQDVVPEVRTDVAWAILELAHRYECSQPVPRVVLDAAESVLGERCAAGDELLRELSRPGHPPPDENGDQRHAPLREPDPDPTEACKLPAASDDESGALKGLPRRWLAKAVIYGMAAGFVVALVLFLNAWGDSRTASWAQTSPMGSSAHHGETRPIALHPDGRTLATTDGDQYAIRLWDLRRRLSVRELSGPNSTITDVAFSPDGRLLAGSGPDAVWLWDMSDSRRNGRVLASLSTLSVAFSPDGRTLATGGRDDTVRLWDTVTGKEVGGPLRGHG